MDSKKFTRHKLLAALVLAAAGLSQANSALSADNLFAGGWVLDTASSNLTFQSIKNGDNAETSSFASYQGSIDDQGVADIRVQLDSIDTKIDLRNVRMRYLFFETFKFQEAVIRAKINPDSLRDLPLKRRLRVPLTFDMTLHGITKTLQVDTNVTMFSDSQVSVASLSALPIGTGMFGLDEGLNKLQEAAGVQIVPVGSVNFDFVFNLDRAPAQVAVAEPVPVPVPAPVPAPVPEVVAAPVVSTAVEPAGRLSRRECAGRFKTLSQTGDIRFASSSAKLDPGSEPTLDTIYDVISRCPQLKVMITGHTDSLGDATANLELSIARADSVRRYLINRGIQRHRIQSGGYGEARPIVPNNTRKNRSRNRRIEFSVTDS